MVSSFVIKKGKEDTFRFLVICLLLIVIWSFQTQFHVGLVPLILIASIAVLFEMVLFFRWFFSFAVFLDMEKREIILNHSLFFRKKRISLKDIKEIDTLNGTIILFGSTPLSKLQRIVSKTKKFDDYTIRFETIETSERRELMKLLSKWDSKSKE